MKTPVNKQPAKERINNFFEVALGLSKEEAVKEAARCLGCKNPPCVKGCPVEIDIPEFIRLIKEGKPEEAIKKIKEKNALPAICGRVCPQENQCEAVCVLNKKKIAINIGALERYAAESDLKLSSLVPRPSSRNNKRVSVVGSGPAGLTCAAELAKMGRQVSLFESLHIPGGVLSYGIPEFRLPKEIVKKEIEYIKTLAVDLKTDILIGNTYSLNDIFDLGYKAIFLALGAGLPQFLGIQGENLIGVYSANEFLTRINLMKAHKFPEYATPINVGKKVAVIGGGNVALDAARVVMRLGKQAILVYRRSESEMPGRAEEIDNAKEEGVIFQFLTQPLKIVGGESGFVKGLECVKMKLGEPDASGRRKPAPIENSNFILGADSVVVAIGQRPNPLLTKATKGLKIRDNGTIVVDKHYMTSLPGVFAGGDIITGADTVIQAMGAGKKAAIAIDKYLK